MPLATCAKACHQAWRAESFCSINRSEHGKNANIEGVARGIAPHCICIRIKRLPADTTQDKREAMSNTSR